MKQAARRKPDTASSFLSLSARARAKTVLSSALALCSAVFVALACNPTSAPKEAHDAKSEPSASATPPPPVASASAAVSCGAVTCKAGEVCCNASCGICTPPDGMCTQQFCAPDAGSPAASSAPSSSSSAAPAPRGPASCASDADCRTWSSYCDKTPCLCFALGASEAAPKCAGSTAACLVDPCKGKVAACRAGRCTIAQPAQK